MDEVSKREKGKVKGTKKVLKDRVEGGEVNG